MSWTCPQCGITHTDSETACGCGHTKIPESLVLVSEKTGKSVSCRINMTFGSSNLRRIEDPEVEYASSEQFRVEKCPDKGGWCVFHITQARNATYVNGKVVETGGIILKDGDKISLNDKVLRLTVTLK